MPLEHISAWRDGYGFCHTTPDEAVHLTPYGASANDRIFLCESCSQYASFVVGENQVPFFRHPAGSKECDDKRIALSKYYKMNRLGYSLPLKIVAADNELYVYIGFLPLTDVQLNKAIQKEASVSIFDGKQALKTYRINCDRFSSEHINYLSVGNKICEYYSLEYSNVDNSIKDIWQQLVSGFSTKGTLFDPDSGKRLPTNADVEVSRKYCLITKKHILTSFKDVSIERVRPLNGGWQMYFVKANILSKDAAEFFATYCSARLSETPACITPLWPPCMQSAHILSTKSAPTVFYHKGGGCVEVWPCTTAFYQNDAEGNGRLISCSVGPVQQILSISRFERHTSVLRYLVLNKKLLPDYKSIAAEVLICDEAENKFVTGAHYVLPKGKILAIESSFDGCVQIMKSGTVLHKIKLKGSEKATITVNWGYSILVYQGLDLISELSFMHKSESEKASKDTELLMRLMSYKGRMIPISHEFGRIAEKLDGYPETATWLLKQIRNRKISKQAFNVLTNNRWGE